MENTQVHNELENMLRGIKH